MIVFCAVLSGIEDIVGLIQKNNNNDCCCLLFIF